MEEAYPEYRKSQKAKARFSKYKAGGKRRIQKKKKSP